MSLDRTLIDPLRRASQRLCCVAVSRSSAYALAILAGCVAGVAIIDQYLQFYTPLGRWLASSLVLLAATVGVALVVMTWLRFRHRDHELAAFLEEEEPVLRGWLLNSLAFLAEGTAAHDRTVPTSGESQQAVLEETARRLAPLDVPNRVTMAPAWRAWRWSAILLALASVLSLAFPGSYWNSLRRLIAPWQSITVSRAHSLAALDPPSRVPRGSNVSLRIVDQSGHPPDSISLIWKTQVGSSQITHKRTMQRAGGVFTHVVTNVQAPFSFRAVGGDDRSMPWHRVHVSEPVQVGTPQVSIHPLPYTGLSPEHLQGSFTGLAGSAVVVSAKVDRPVAVAQLIVSDERGRMALPMSVDRKAKRITLAEEWRLQRSGEFWFHLQDDQGAWTPSHDRWPFIVTTDHAPIPEWSDVFPDKHVTPHTRLDLRGRCLDDYGIEAISWLLRRSTNNSTDPGSPSTDGDQVRSVVPDASRNHEGVAESSADRHPKTIDFHTPIRLDEVLPVSPGDRVSIRIKGTDTKGQIAMSPWRTWQVVSADDAMAQFQAVLIAVIQQLREARGRQLDLIDRHTASGQLDVHRLLVDGHESALARLQQLLKELDASGLSVTPLRDPAADMAARLAATAKQIIAPLESRLRELPPRTSAPLPAEVREGQALIAATLAGILARSDQWQGLSALFRQLESAYASQHRLLDATEGKIADVEKPPGDERVELMQEQEAVRRALAYWRVDADTWLKNSDALPADAIIATGQQRLREGLRGAESANSELTAQSAADHLARRQWSLASRDQQKVLRDLAQLRNILQGGPPSADDHPTAPGNDIPDGREGTSTEDSTSPTQTAPNSQGESPGNAGTRAGAASSTSAADSTRVDSLSHEGGPLRPWGDLPPRVQEALLQADTLNFLPGYENVTRDYYRRLADPQSVDSRRRSPHELE